MVLFWVVGPLEAEPPWRQRAIVCKSSCSGGEAGGLRQCFVVKVDDFDITV